MKDANPGGRGWWHCGTHGLRGVHGVRSKRRREIGNRKGRVYKARRAVRKGTKSEEGIDSEECGTVLETDVYLGAQYQVGYLRALGVLRG